jgi:hypothetical protein
MPTRTSFVHGVSLRRCTEAEARAEHNNDGDDTPLVQFECNKTTVRPSQVHFLLGLFTCAARIRNGVHLESREPHPAPPSPRLGFASISGFASLSWISRALHSIQCLFFGTMASDNLRTGRMNRLLCVLRRIWKPLAGKGRLVCRPDSNIILTPIRAGRH